jgi:ELWxxDGT repeat protein
MINSGTGKAFFKANDGVHGIELWITDGTDAGTVLVKDINSGSGSSSPLNFTVVGTTLYFSATDGTNGIELWKSDGTAGGTSMVKDINTAGDSNPASIISSAGSIYFSASDGVSGTELWKTDGTTLGTVLVSDINPGAASSNPNYLTNVNSTLLFSADDGTHGQELWTINGALITATQPSISAINKQVSPNPTAGEVNISGIQLTETLQLYNSVGVLMNTYSGSETLNIDLSSSNNGVYILRSSEGGFLKIVKQ